VIFAYQDSTDVEMRELSTQTKILEVSLDSAEYHVWEVSEQGEIPFVSIESNLPVSVASNGYHVGMYTPSFNGTFTGQHFFSYLPYTNPTHTHFPQEINIVPYGDNTTVTVTALENPLDTIWEVMLPKRGEITGKGIVWGTEGPQALYIHADKDISVSLSPYTNYGVYDTSGSGYSAREYGYLLRGIDRSGLGLGNDFFIPLLCAEDINDTSSWVKVISLQENSHVRIGRIPKWGGDEEQLLAGYLDRGESHFYATIQPTPFRPSGCVDSGTAVYHVTSSQLVCVISNNSLWTHQQLFGADFMPVYSTKKTMPLEIRPDYFRVVSAGVAELYELEVINNSYDDDVVEISWEESIPDWSHDITDTAGSPLADTDADGSPDLGPVASDGGIAGLLLRVQVPGDALAGQEDTVVIYARSSNVDTLYDSAVVRTRVLKEGTLTIESDQTGEVSFEDLTISYPLDVTNNRNIPEIGEITWRSSLGWPVEVYDATGEVRLGDSNLDGNPDVGILEEFGGSSELIVQVENMRDFDPTVGGLDTTSEGFSAAETTVVYVHAASDGIISDSAILVTLATADVMMHNYPNPFTDETRIVWNQPEDGEITIRLADRSGRYVTTIYKGECETGIHTHLWEAETVSGDALAPGVYMVILDYKPQDGNQKRILTKTLCTGRRR